ncbi:hypothetical protein, partial [uncultured Thiodictyon sp.]|uniref:hypothetical protein n=1 Tax=uncultured Thiodictyon sp. TaxID=1846217 RepID=UPI0025CF3527
PLQALAGRATLHPWNAFPVDKPEQLETQKGCAPLWTRMEAAKTQNLRNRGQTTVFALITKWPNQFR